MENPNQKWMRTGDWGYPYFRKPPYLSKKHVHPSRPHGLGLTPRPQYAMMQRPDSVKKEWLNGQSTGKSNGHLCPWSNPSEKCGSNKSNGDWIDWMEHRTIYICFFCCFLNILLPSKYRGVLWIFPFREPFLVAQKPAAGNTHGMNVTPIRCRRRPQTCLDGRWWMVNTCHWSGGPQGHTAPAGRIGAIIIIFFFRSSKGWMGHIFLLGVS
jgi:hypothetical protein